MGAGRLLGRLIRLSCAVAAVCGWALIGSVASAKPPTVVVNPTPGQKWSATTVLTPGETGELRGIWTLRFDKWSTSASGTTAGFTLSYFGDISFHAIVGCPPGPPYSPPVLLPSTAATVSGNFNSGSANLDASGPAIVQNAVMDFCTPSNGYQQQGAVSYVKYRNAELFITLEYPASEVGGPGKFGGGASLDAPTLGGRVAPLELNFPGIAKGSGTTSTTKPKSNPATTIVGSSTTVAPTDSTVTDSTVPTTDPNGTTDSTTTTTTTPAAVVPPAPPDKPETPAQTEVRRSETVEGTAASVVAAAIALTNLIPVAAAAGVAGAVGSVGIMAGRSLSGPGLLPGGGVSSASLSSATAGGAPQTGIGHDFRNRTDDIRASSSDGPGRQKLSDEYRAPSGNLAETGRKGRIVGVSGLFSFLVHELQWVSRLRILRPGIKRITEVTVLSPIAGLMVQVFPFVFAAAIASRFDASSSVTATWMFIALVAMTVLAPLLGIIAVAGWFVGSFIGSGNPFLAVSDSLALAPGLILMPMAVRSLVGPFGRTSRIEMVGALALGPVIGYQSYRGWLLGLDSISNTVMRSLSGMGLPVGSKVSRLNVDATSTHVAVLAATTIVVALLAVRFADRHGAPRPIFKRTYTDDPTINVRRLFVERSTLRIPEASRMNRLGRFALAAAVSFVFMRGLVGWWAVGFIVIFFVGVVSSRTAGRRIGYSSLHPIVKAFPMFLVGKWIGTHDLSGADPRMSMFVVAVIAIAALFVRTRQLWD